MPGPNIGANGMADNLNLDTLLEDEASLLLGTWITDSWNWTGSGRN